MKSKTMKVIVIIAAVIVALIVADKILVNNHVYKFSSSMFLGLLIGGLIALAVWWIGVFVVAMKKTGEFSKKGKIIMKVSMIGVVVLSCVISFLLNGDFVRKVSNKREQCFCNEKAVYCSNQWKDIGYCEEHKTYLLESMERSHSSRDKSSGGGGNYDKYDYDKDGDVHGKEYWDAFNDTYDKLK